MIVINLLPGQGLGNQLWNIFAAKQLSLFNDCNLQIGGYENFKGSDFIKFKCLNIKESHVCSEFKFLEDLYYDKRLKYVNSGYDIKFKKLKPPFEIEGLFQDERYILPLVHNGEDFVSVSQSHLGFSENLCVLNIRGGEFKRTRAQILPKSYWEMAMEVMREQHDIEDFVIVTDDAPYSRRLFPNIPIISNSVKDCFSALMEAKYIITSNSSFSYFPIALSPTKKFILAPKFMNRFQNNTTWCSVGNIYENYNYMDSFGGVTTASENKASMQSASKIYRDNKILVSPDDLFEVGIRKLLNKNSRRQLKKLLVNLMPSRF